MRCFFTVFTVLLYFAAAHSAHADYKLGVGDELRLVVADQPQISGKYAVSDDGTVFIVLGGRVKVEGLSIEAAADAIRVSLSKYISDPALALEVSTYRPYFIMGDITNPGMYASIPGMTVMKAMARAGGLRRRRNNLEYATTSIRANESYFVALKQRLDAQVQKTRLQAELDNKPILEWNNDNLSPNERAMLDNAVSYQKEILATNNESFKKQIELLEDLIDLRNSEIQTLERRFNALERQNELLRVEIKSTEDRLKRGNSTILFLNSLNREETRSISESLQIRLSQNQAQQKLNEARLQLTTLVRDRKIQLLDQIGSVNQKLQQLGEQIKAAEALMQETEYGYDMDQISTTLSLTLRGKDGMASDVTVEDTHVIQPGDIITVKQVISKPNTNIAR